MGDIDKSFRVDLDLKLSFISSIQILPKTRDNRHVLQIELTIGYLDGCKAAWDGDCGASNLTEHISLV